VAVVFAILLTMGGFFFTRVIHPCQTHQSFHHPARAYRGKGVAADARCATMHAYGSAGHTVRFFIPPVMRVWLDEPALVVSHQGRASVISGGR
jgi:hypothetical protein